MANIITPVDAGEVLSAAYVQATGREALDTIDTTTFANVVTVLKSDTVMMDNFIGSINLMLLDTVIAIRDYDEHLNLLNVSAEQWGAAKRKISFLYKAPDDVKFRNTDKHTQTFKDGETIDMYTIKKGDCVTTVITGKKSFQDHITIPDRQLDQAFTSFEQFVAWLNGMLMNFANIMKKYNEEMKRLTLANKFASAYLNGANNSMALNMAKLFNEEYGTNYKVSELKTKYLPAFTEFLVETVKNLFEFMTEQSTLYHEKIDGKDIDRHTPKSLQKMLLSTTWVNKIETRVYPNLFNVQWVDIGKEYEKVNFWQNIRKPNAISIKPNIVDPDTGASVDGDVVEIDEIIGCIFDVEAIGVTENFKRTYVTPYNASGEYRNQYFNWDFNSYQDDSENFILLYMEDEEEPTPGGVVDVAPVAQNRKLFDVTASTFQKNDIVVSDNGISGTLKEMVDSNPITDVWGTGYFIGLKFVLPEGCTSCKVGLNPSEGSGLVEIIDDPDKDGVFKVTDKDTQNIRVESIVNGVEVVKEYDLSTLTLQAAN